MVDRGVQSPPEPGARRLETRSRRNNVTVSRLTLTIVIANLIGLVILLLGSFALTQYRDGLVQSKLEGVRAQAQIIADILSNVAIDEGACQALEQNGADTVNTICPLSLSRRNVKDVFNRVWDSFEGRVRIFQAPSFDEGVVITDASQLLIEDVVLRVDSIEAEPLPPLSGAFTLDGLKARYRNFTQWVSEVLPGGYRREAAQRTIEAELTNALKSSPFADERGAASVRMNEDGELVVSVSIPIRRVQAISGLVTAEIGGIDDLVARARWSVLPFFGLSCTAAILSSLLLTAAIAQPIRQLANAADKVREGISAAGRERIPDFSSRRDEIGELSSSLKSMTQAIYDRMEAIESFAADVAHELKNPLTSIRSATETLEIAASDEAREKLMGVIKSDVARMDRLITDISNASRLDAELAREGRAPVDLVALISDITAMYKETCKEGEPDVSFTAPAGSAYIIGNAAALGQVIRNLIDNARSFSPPGAGVRVSLRAGEGVHMIYVEDKGPGVPVDVQEKIFSRFYTKRPAGTAFGNNSGLGLAIVRQIVHSHGGEVWVENRGGNEVPIGARFIIELPSGGYALERITS